MLLIKNALATLALFGFAGLRPQIGNIEEPFTGPNFSKITMLSIAYGDFMAWIA